MTIHDERQAFPRPNGGERGMTLLEYYAVTILAGMCANPDCTQLPRDLMAREALGKALTLLKATQEVQGGV